MTIEIDKHNPMLKNLDSNFDKIQSKSKRLQNKLNQYVSEKSNCCLTTTICLEILFILLLILVL